MKAVLISLLYVVRGLIFVFSLFSMVFDAPVVKLGLAAQWLSRRIEALEGRA